MIGITQHTFKQQPSLIQLFGICQTCTRQGLHEPKRAHVESAFLSRKPIDAGLRRIAIDKAVADEATLAGIFEDGSYGVEHPRIGRRHEEDERHDKERSIQVLTAVKLCKRVAFLAPALGHYFFVDTVPLSHPFRAIGWKRTLFGQTDAAIQGNPVHDLRSEEHTSEL